MIMLKRTLHELTKRHGRADNGVIRGWFKGQCEGGGKDTSVICGISVAYSTLYLFHSYIFLRNLCLLSASNLFANILLENKISPS